MKVIFVYSNAAFWTAIFENGAEIDGFIEHKDALNATYDERLAKHRSEIIVLESTTGLYSNCG